MSSKRNWILAAIMAVAVVIGYVALTGKFPRQSETQGAIGAAHRYQTGQISASDVTLQDAKIQAFLQTDLFHKIATDAKFRTAIANPSFQAIVKNPSFQKMAGDGSLSEYLNRYKGLFQRDEFDAMLATKKLQNVETEQMVHVLQNKNFQQLAMDPSFVEMLKDPKFDAMMEQADAQKATTVKQVQEIAETSKNVKLLGLTEMAKKNTFAQLLADDVLQKAATQAQLMDLADLLQNTKIGTMLNDNSFQELLANPKAMSFMTSEEMSEVAMNLSEMAHQPSAAELLEVAADPSVLDALSRPEMQELANADLLQTAVGSVKNN